MPRPRRDAPNVSTEDWHSSPCADPVAEVMRLVAVNLRSEIGERSLRSVARDTGVPHAVISTILRGSAWVEAATIARLEVGMGTTLWPIPK